MSAEPIVDEYGDALTCDYCSVGAAVVEIELQEHERLTRKAKGYVDRVGFMLCELCHLGSVRARGHIAYNTLPDQEILTEKAAARMLNAMRGTLGS